MSLVNAYGMAIMSLMTTNTNETENETEKQIAAYARKVAKAIRRARELGLHDEAEALAKMAQAKASAMRGAA